MRGVTAVLGVGVVAPDAPVLRGDIPGIMRGDGIFETMHVRSGQAWLLDEHLARMARSAARMQLALPPAEALRDLTASTLRAWPAATEGRLRLVCARGADDEVIVYASVSPVGPGVLRARRDGVTVVTESISVPARTPPDESSGARLLAGAKTLSYALNSAALRRARSAGADDVLWVSSDGFALESPTSSLVWLDGGTLRTVPADDTGILAGTTAARLLARAGELGVEAGEGLVPPEALHDSGGAWLTSSVRVVAAIRSLDGVALPYDPELTARIHALLGLPAHR